MPANKVKFGLSNVHVVETILADDGSASFGETILKVPGSVDLVMDPANDAEPFRADDIDYWNNGGTPGFSGKMEMALFPAAFKIMCLSFKRDGKGVLYEPSPKPDKHFAIMFQFKNDANRTRHIIHNVTFGRLSIASHTTVRPEAPITESIPMNSSPIYVPALDEWIDQAEMDEATDATVYNNFFTTPYIPAPAESENPETPGTTENH